MYDNNPRYEKIDETTYLDLETDEIVHVFDEAEKESIRQVLARIEAREKAGRESGGQ